MGGYIARRLLSTLVVMAIVGIIVFLLVHLAPGSPAAIIAGDNASPAQIDMISHQLGLDEPLPVQFGIWAWNILRGNFGTSIFSGAPVMQLVDATAAGHCVAHPRYDRVFRDDCGGGRRVRRVARRWRARPLR